MFSIYDGRSKFYQWDKDRKLIVDDPTITQVHFANCLCPNAQVSEVYDWIIGMNTPVRVADVPNDLLTEYMDIRVWGYDGEMTRYDDLFEVVKRTKPSDYIYTPTEVLTLGALEARIAALEDAMKPVAFTIDGVEYVVDGKMTWQKAIKNNLLEQQKYCSMCGVPYSPYDVRNGYAYKTSSYEECMSCWSGAGKDASGACASCGETGYFEMVDLCDGCGGEYNPLYTSQGELVKATDYITEGETYSTQPTYFTFTINGKEHECVENATWSEFCSTSGTLNCISCGLAYNEYQPVDTSAGYKGIGKVVLEGNLDCNVCYSETTTPDNLDKVCSCGSSSWAHPDSKCPNCGGAPIKGVIFDANGNQVEADARIEPAEYIWNKEAF